MAIRINIDEIEYGSSFQRFYDEAYFKIVNEFFKEKHITIEEELACHGYKSYIARDIDGYISHVMVTIYLNREPIAFMLSDDDIGEDLESALSLDFESELYHCKRHYMLNIPVFEQKFLVDNSLGVEPEIAVIYDKNEDTDKNLYVGRLELQKIEDDGSMKII